MSLSDNDDSKIDNKHLQNSDISSSGSEPELRLLNDSPNPNRFISNLTEPSTSGTSSYVTTMVSRRPPEARSRMTAAQSSAQHMSKQIRLGGSSSESDSDSDEDGARKSKAPEVTGAYDPKLFDDITVSDEIKELFTHITRYTPQKIELDYKFKPFVPEFIPAVGDTDAFLKVVTPERNWLGETFDNGSLLTLGLEVLDEPSGAQSDPALLYLQLRATEKTKKSTTNLNVKKVDNAGKNTKLIDQWINDISDLHTSHPPPTVIYRNAMPSVDELLQDWPPEEADALKDGFPNDRLNCSLEHYVDLVCSIFDIPVYESRIESLHVLFSMCLAVKNYYLYVNNGNANENVDILEIDDAPKKLSTESRYADSDDEQVVFK